MDTAEARAREKGTPSEAVYDGFLSYSHAADDLLAPRLQAGLQRFAKPWWKRRALRIFRDEASLSANPHLWSSITEALDQSDWFVLLLSPDAAQSEWVNREVEYWLEHKEGSRIVPVVTDGEFGWADGDIGPDTDSAPPALYGAFGEEPRWVDLRWASTGTDLDLRNSQFRAAVADIASAIRGVAKDELASEEVKQHRRTIRTAWAAGIALFLLVLLAGGAALFAVGQRNEAVENERVAQARELAAASLANLQVDPDRSLLLALEAARMTSEGDGTVLREAAEALHGALLASRLEATLPDSGRGAFSPDGRLFVAGDPAAPATLARPTVALGAFRLRLVAEDADGRATIWDAVSRERLGECCDHIPGADVGMSLGQSRGVSYVVLSGDGRLAATTGPDDRVKVWEIATGTLLLDVGHFAAFSPALSPDGALVAATSVRGQVNVWEVATGEQLVTLPRLPEPTAGIAFSPHGTLLAVAVWDGTARVYEVGTWNVRTVLDHGGPVWDVTFDPTGERLVTASGDTTAVLWDVVSGERLQTFRGHSAAVGGVDFSPEGGRIATGSSDGTARVWNVESGEVMIELATGGVIDYVTFSPDGSRLATAQADGTAKIWNISAQGGGEVLAISERGPVASVAFDGRHRLATVGAENGDIHVYEVSSGSELLHLPGVSQAGRITFSADGSLLGAPGPNNTAIVLDSETGDVLLTLEGHEAASLSFGFSHDGQWIVTTGGEGAVRLWNAATGEERLSDRPTGGSFARPPYVVTLGPAFTARFSPDDLLVLSASRDGVAQLSEVPIGRARRRFEHPAALSAATFSPDGKLVATASDDGTATIWDVDTAERLHVLAVSAVGVSDVEFSPDGSRLATGSADGTVKLWDAATGEELLGLQPHTAGITDLDFSHDGLYLATAGMDGTVQVLLLDVGQLVELAQSRVTRSLTDFECQRYLHLPACPGGT